MASVLRHCIIRSSVVNLSTMYNKHVFILNDELDESTETPTSFKSPLSLAVSSTSRSHSGCVLHQGMHAIDSYPFHSMTIWPPIPQIYTIWPWKFKVKGKGQRYPSQSSVLVNHHFRVSHQGILSTPVPLVLRQWVVLFQRYYLTLKIQGQRSRSKVLQSLQRPVDSFPECFTSGHPIDPCTFCFMTIGPPILEIQFDLEN